MSNDVQVKLDIFHREDEEINVGDVVATTTSEFDFNGITHCFDKEATEYTTVIATLVESDYTDFDADKCRNGGKYGFDYFKVDKVIEKDIDVEFKCVLTKDENIEARGVFNTSDADDERPIQWHYYGLRWYFPNNPFDPDYEIGEWNRYESLRTAVLTDDLLVQFLCDFAEEDVTIEREGYKLIINGGN